MKSVKTYIPSLILTVIMVFFILGSSAAIIADLNITAAHFKKTASEENIPEKIYSTLDRNYRDKANATGIPASVYMDNLSEDYLEVVMNEYISAGFSAFSSGKKLEANIPDNKALEDAITDFFSDYADKTGYVKDEKYDKKLSETISSAYKTIGSYSDAYKLSTLSEHGVSAQVSKIYRHRGLLTAAIAAGLVLVVLMILFVNRKYKRMTLYWCGAASLTAGLLGAIPSIWLVADRYYDSFTIKQPQVFSVYTSTMYRITEAFMASQIAVSVIGITMIVVYSVMCGISRSKSSAKTVTVTASEVAVDSEGSDDEKSISEDNTAKK